MRHYNVKRTPDERFLGLLKKGKITESGCIEWPNASCGEGYGHFFHNMEDGKPIYMYAHRYAYTREHGPIPDGMVVCHTCDNPSCVNVGHLFVGSQKTNVADSIRKGKRGSGKPVSKLTRETAMEIRASNIPSMELAKMYGISRTQVNNVKSYRQWVSLA
jgi:hypothetical protein